MVKLDFVFLHFGRMTKLYFKFTSVNELDLDKIIYTVFPGEASRAQHQSKEVIAKTSGRGN